MNEVKHKVQSLLSASGCLPEAGPMLCGLSGGADSVALVLVLRELGYEVVGLHCNFQLRGEESERDERFVRQLCECLNLPLHTVRFDTRGEATSQGESIEMAARRLRYAWFRDEREHYDRQAAESGASRHATLCVAHHADDNVETMLLNLIRGAGLHGLTGMHVQNDWGVLRPLLTTTRAEILDYLAKNGQTYVTDSTNADTHYRRNKVRHELLPLLRTINPGIDRTLTETMSRLRETEEWLVSHDETGLFALRAQLQEQGFNMDQILQMEVAHDGAYVIQGGQMLTKHRGRLVVGAVPEIVGVTPLPMEGVTRLGRMELCTQCCPLSSVATLRDQTQAVLDVRAVKGRLIVRSVEDGDRFRPYGLKGTKLVNDYLKDRKRSRIEKMAALVVCDDSGILWLVGETVAQRAAVVADTTEVLTILFSS